MSLILFLSSCKTHISEPVRIEPPSCPVHIKKNGDLVDCLIEYINLFGVGYEQEK